MKPLTAEVIAQIPEGHPVIMTNKVGRGRVFYSADIPEMHAPARTTDIGRMVYASFLEWAGVKRFALQPGNPSVHFFQSVTSRGELLFTLVNRDNSLPFQQVHFETPVGEVRVDVAKRMTGAIAVTANEEVQSIETSEIVEGHAETYCDSSAHIMLFGLDKRDLRQSEALCLLPMGEGKVRIRSSVLDDSTRVEVGSFKDGRWVRLEEAQLSPQGGWIEVNTTQDRNLSVILMAPSSQMEKAVELLTKLLENAA